MRVPNSVDRLCEEGSVFNPSESRLRPLLRKGARLAGHAAAVAIAAAVGVLRGDDQPGIASLALVEVMKDSAIRLLDSVLARVLSESAATDYEKAADQSAFDAKRAIDLTGWGKIETDWALAAAKATRASQDLVERTHALVVGAQTAIFVLWDAGIGAVSFVPSFSRTLKDLSASLSELGSQLDSDASIDTGAVARKVAEIVGPLMATLGDLGQSIGHAHESPC